MNATVQFHEESPPDVEGYLPFDFVSLVAVVLSGFSIGTYWVPAFALLGIPALVLGWKSSVAARRKRTASIGGYLGIFALMFGTFNAATGLASNYFHRAHLAHVANEQVEAWIAMLVDGRKYEAYELHKQYQDRQIVGTNLEEYYRKDMTFGMPSELPESEEERMRMQMSMPTVPAWQEFEMFYTSEPLKTVMDHLDDGKLVYRGLQGVKWDGPDTRVVLRYSWIYRLGGAERDAPVVFDLMRSKYEGGEYHWKIHQVMLPARGE